MKHLVIIDYGSGNLRSVHKAFEHVADDSTRVEVTSDAAALLAATHIVLPGVGAFGDCMQGLNALSGMCESMEKRVLGDHVPFLGICVGMQLLFEEGHEHGVHKGLGWLKGKVVPLTPADPALKVPHMGWNDLSINKNHPLLTDMRSGAHAYFVHSYHARCADGADTLATANYGGPVTAIVARGNIMGTQFHPEKSQATGLQLLANFLRL